MGLDARQMSIFMTITDSFRAVARRATGRVLLAAFAALVLMLIDRGAGHRVVHASSPTIAQENAQHGATDWDVTGAGDPDVQGFATDISVNIGQTVHFKIAAPGAATYQIKIYSNQSRFCAKPCRSRSRFATGVPGTYNNYVKLFLEKHNLFFSNY